VTATRRQPGLPAAAVVAFDRWRAALDTVGRGDAAGLTWIQTFATRDLETPGAAAQAAVELNLFCGAQSRWSKNWAAQSRRVPGLRLMATTDEVREAQRVVRTILDGLRTTGTVWFPPLVLGLTWDRARAAALVTQGGPVAQILVALGELVVRVGARLRACARLACGRLFLSTRPWHAVCSRRCGTSVRVARYRQRDRARASARDRARYVATVKRRLPLSAKVTIARRPRRRLA
jgi:hypothetical protein